jgi:hypothetical protein
MRGSYASVLAALDAAIHAVPMGRRSLGLGTVAGPAVCGFVDDRVIPAHGDGV